MSNSVVKKEVLNDRTFEKEFIDENSSDSSESLHNNLWDKNFTTKRHLKGRHLQLIAIGGSIGTGLFVTIGGGLINGGAAGLLIATLFWNVVILLLTSAVGEMVVQYPTPAPFVEMAGRCVDELLEFSSGWNFFLMELFYIPFEITAVSSIINYWRDDFSPLIPISIIIVIYFALNSISVKYFGESEFWLSIAKLILCIGLLFFTLITMCGGNPSHDAFGFRNFRVGPWGDDTIGSLAMFEGWLSAWLSTACFFVVGPEYISSAVNEVACTRTRNVRQVISAAFNSVIWRLVLFYVFGALSVGILVAYNDPTLTEAHSAGTSNAAASPYVISMTNMGIKVLPDIVNAIILMSALSAGNSYVYCSSRQLYSLSKRGFAPGFFQVCTKSGIPIFCVVFVMLFSFLSYLQLSSGGAYTALTYITSICTKSQMITYLNMAIAYIGFYRATKAQGVDKSTYYYRSWYQPYSVYFVLFFLVIVCGIQGYTVFKPGMWSVENFIFYYVMIFVNIFAYLFWKILKRTKVKSPMEVDLIAGLKEIDDYEYSYYNELGEDADSPRTQNLFGKILTWIF